MMRRILPTLAIAYVAVGSANAVVFDFNSGGDGFVSTSPTGAFDGPWTYGAASGVGGSGGWSTEGQIPDNGHGNTTNLTSPTILVSFAGTVTLTFEHSHNFEDGGGLWDGGAVFISVNAGAFTKVAAASFTSNGYTGVVVNGFGNPLYSELGGEMAFTGSSGGYKTSVATLGSFGAGDLIQIQFKAAYDANTSGGSPDWAIDNVNVATPVPEPFTIALALGGLGTAIARRRRRS